MTISELLATVRRVEVRTNRLVNDMMVGAYLSHFKGRGMDFEELREYITTNTGRPPHGQLPRKSLMRMAMDARPDRVA